MFEFCKQKFIYIYIHEYNGVNYRKLYAGLKLISAEKIGD